MILFIRQGEAKGIILCIWGFTYSNRLRLVEYQVIPIFIVKYLKNDVLEVQALPVGGRLHFKVDPPNVTLLAVRHRQPHTYARSLPLRGQRTVHVGARPGQPERQAVVAVAFAPVLLWPPHVCRGLYEKRPRHQNRKGDHRPGWLVLWRGWMALQHMVDGAEALKSCG